MSSASSVLPATASAIEIRDARVDDAEAVHEMMQSSEVIAGTMRLPYAPIATTADRLKPDPGTHQIVAVVDGVVAGFGELLSFPLVPRHRHVGEVNMVFVHPDWHGRGIGRRLMETLIDLGDNWLQMRRLELTVWETNRSARTLYESCGFEIEGRFRDYVFTDGRFVDALKMARIHAQ